VTARLSRRDFLKLMGSSAIVFGLGIFGVGNYLRSQQNLQRATAQSQGSWSSNSDTDDVAIHCALLKNGNILYVAGSALHNPQIQGPYRHGIYNPTTGSQQTFTLGEDLFCVGMATLADGNILLAGGTLAYDSETLNGKFHGPKWAYEADFETGSIGKRSEMRHGRWYPTCVALPDGKVFVIQGLDEYGCYNKIVEVYNPSNRSWSLLLDPNGSGTYSVGYCATDFYPEAGSPTYGPGTIPSMTLYPRMHLMPNGKIFMVGQGSIARVCDPTTGAWVGSTSMTPRAYGTSVLCPLQNTDTEKGKILVCGGSPTPPNNSTASAQIAQPSGTNGISFRSIASMNHARKHMFPVILPTGEIVIFGGNLQGTRLDNAVYAPELFDPVSETWTDLPSASVPRTYHQTAILMMDGRVWNAGTTPDKLTKILEVEIFNPWYTSETRPTISGDPTGGAFGSTITIPTPDAADITKVSLIRQSSCTHHYNTDQRLIWLQVESKASSSVTVKAPINDKLAPPGMYLIHVLSEAGVPSTGKFIKMPGGSAPPPPPSGEFVSIYSVTPTNSYLKMYTGSLKRAGEWMTSSSVLIGESIKRVSIILKKSGSPRGTISVVVRKGSGDSIALTFGTIDASTLRDTDQTFTLTAPSSYTFAANDKVLAEWSGTGSGTDQVWVKRRYSSDPTTGYDGSATRQAHYVSSYSSNAGSDIGGEWFKET
jgi:hypothetical protein